MKKILVGYTGFVGSNLYEKGEFDAVFNSKNIEEAYGTNPEILYYAGVRAEKFLANKFPDKDMESIESAMDNITKINPSKLVLISTIDVYPDPANVDEDSIIDEKLLQPYGANRLKLEQWVKSNFKDCLIVRLPGLFGKNIKKNFIYDFIHIMPAMLTGDKFEELQDKAEKLKLSLKEDYILQDNGFFKYIAKDNEEERKNTEKRLREIFSKIGFSALNFTDSRGVFQFYDLSMLYDHIENALKHNISVLNIATEPVSVGEIYEKLTGKLFINEIAKVVPYYNYKSKYADLLDGEDGYLCNKEQVICQIEKFVKDEQENL